MKPLFVLSLFLPLVVSAQVYNCDGVFTNFPCHKPKPPAEAKKENNSDKDSLKKQTLLHDLTMKSINYRKKHGIKTDISEANDACTDKESPLEVCRTIVEKFDRSLEQKRVQAVEVFAKEKEIDAGKTPAVVQKVEQKTVVVINQPRTREISLFNRRINGIEVLPRPPVASPSHSEPPVAPAPNPPAVNPVEPSAGSIVGPK